MSISKIQAEALAEGFLDNKGDNREGLRPKNLCEEMILLAAELVEAAQDNLINSNSIASGKLSESLVLGEPEINSSVFKIDVFMNFYGKFVNKGVKGTRAGQSTAGYSFKNEFPSKSMVAAINEYLKNARVTTRTVKKYSGYGKHEIKNKSLAELDSAYAFARSIKIHGIEPTGFLDKAVNTTKQKVKDRLGAALKIDILNSLK